MTNTFFTYGLQLISSSQESNPITINNPTAIHNKEYIFKNNVVKIDHNDCQYYNFHPTYIVSDHKLDNLIFKINENIIKFPLVFCNSIFNFNKKIKNKKIYKIPWLELDMKPLQGPAMKHLNICFMIEHENKPIINAKLYLTIYELLENETIEIIVNKKHENKIIQFSEQSIGNEININKKLNFKGTIKGLFIHNIDITTVNNIQLIVEDEVKINYNREMVLLFLKKITNNIYYLSFDNLEFNNYNWKNAIDFNDFNINFKINFKLKQTKTVVLSALNHNIFTLQNGNCIFYDIPIKPKPQIKIINKFIVGDIILKKIDICPICRDNYSSIITKCNHQYCSECLFELHNIDKRLRCPLCNEDISISNNNIIKRL